MSPWRSCEYSAKMHHKGLEWVVMIWIHKKEDRGQQWTLANMEMKVGFHKITSIVVLYHAKTKNLHRVSDIAQYSGCRVPVSSSLTPQGHCD
jgi:hypothetical protein